MVPRHWGWIEVNRKVTLNGIQFAIKQSVRYTYWDKANNYRWYNRTAPVVIWFGLWELAEARHRESTPVMKTLSQEEKAQLKAIMWARYWDHREVRKRWFARTYGRGAE